MAANVQSFTSWSTTASSNQPDSTDTAAIAEDLQKIQAEVIKYTATKGANIASATTTDLAGATGNYVHITGTTTITGLGTVSTGVRFLLVFDGALTFTHNATSLILPTGANITTEAGDRCEVVSLGTGNFRCLWYQRASGLPLDAELSALAGLTSDANKVPMFSGSGTATLIDFLDEDNMASNAATAVPSQQSVKAYVDSASTAEASTTVAGKIEIATAAEILTGTSETLAMTPGFFADNSGLTASGYYKLPGNMVLQWGITAAITATTTDETLPVSITTGLLVLTNKATVGGTGASYGTFIAGSPVTQVRIGNSGASAAVYWMAIGVA